MKQKSAASRNSILFLLATLFILPVFFSWIVYRYHEYFHLQTSQHGVLLNPPFPALELLGKNFSSSHQWQIVYAPNECDDQANKMLFQLHQLHKALGSKASRVNVIALVQTDCKLKPQQGFHKIIKKLSRRLTINRIYLVDPHDNVFMYYSANTDLMNIFKDIKKVLEVSQIG